MGWFARRSEWDEKQQMRLNVNGGEDFRKKSNHLIPAGEEASTAERWTEGRGGRVGAKRVI